MSEQSINGAHNIQVLIKDSPNCQVLLGDGRLAVELRVPKRGRPLDPSKDKEIDLLLASSAVTTLVGRDGLMRDTLDWCNRGDALSIRCITGRGGSGKTRFALDLVHLLRAQEGWDARFVQFHQPEPFDLWKKTAGDSRRVLLVFDYASDEAAIVGQSLHHAIADMPANEQRRLRILLLARSASWDEGWLKKIERLSSDDDRLSGYCSPMAPIPLEDLQTEDRAALFQEMLVKAAEFIGKPVPAMPEESLFEQESAQDGLRDPLTLTMAALFGVHNGVPRALTLSRTELAHEVAGLFVENRLRTHFPEDPGLACHMMAFVSLCGGLTQQQALNALSAEAEKTSLGIRGSQEMLIRRLHEWFPKDGEGIDTIRPDIVAEAFVLGKQKPPLGMSAEAVLRAAEVAPQPVVAVLMRLAQDFTFTEADERIEPLEWFDTLVTKGKLDDFMLLVAIEAELPYSSVVLRRHAAEVTQSILTRLLALQPAPGSPTNESLAWRSEMGRILNNLSVRQSSIQLRKEALASAIEAVEIFRGLCLEWGRRFLPELAGALNNLALRHLERGDRSASLSASSESTNIYRELTGKERRAFLPDLAMSLNTLGNSLKIVGHRLEAVSAISEAVDCYRELVFDH